MAQQNSFIVDVDLRSHENNLFHRTREIDRERLIVRRGQPFSITVQHSDSLPHKHQLELVLRLGKRDEVVIKVQRQRGTGDKWWFNQQEAQSEILLTLHSPADAIIGQYYLSVLLMSLNGRIVEKMDEISFHLLFNPWCKDDVVYLPDEKLLHEYVMNEDGVIFMGTWDYIRSIPWNYGQFEDFVMDICFEVLDNSKEALQNFKRDIESRSDPVYISRIITAMVNANGDRGVLIGRWKQPYLDGVAPNRWTGSVPILRKWSKDGIKAVKYGQCWVFAGVACTVLRCLGIPTRLITNFASAHDVDGNLSIDFVEDFESREEKNDSSWNFHCWVESWMRRDDLPKGNEGWQVLDPTPQELSDGEFCCGPCPVSAIKEGNLGVKYDAPFIFAEVNADIIYWRFLPGGQKQKIRVDQRSVGKNISTKSVYGNGREDGLKEEREVYEKAGRRVTHHTDGKVAPARLNLLIKHPNPVFGTDFDVILEVTNEGCDNTNVHLTVHAIAVTYNSLHQGECKRQMNNVTVSAQKAHKEVLRFRYEDYSKCVSEHHLIRVKALAEAQEDSLPIMAVADIPLNMPELHVQVLGKAFVWEQLTAYISFTNPLPVPLTGGVFSLEGAGLLSETQIYAEGVISPGQKVSVKISFTPMRTGVRTLLVDFDSDRLKDVKGVASVVVRKKYRNMIPV
ncbi:lipase 2 [Crenichthys baileyi]|uniref:protein-glutamine gamma-glutamyltransferase n=1 Tax=Crenichthys baileyi TaxID=28760 RepID=A0AAV9R0H5_9TELE